MAEVTLTPEDSMTRVLCLFFSRSNWEVDFWPEGSTFFFLPAADDSSPLRFLAAEEPGYCTVALVIGSGLGACSVALGRSSRLPSPSSPSSSSCMAEE